MKFNVYYEGFYVVEAESLEEALDTDRDEAEYEEWQNIRAEETEE